MISKNLLKEITANIQVGSYYVTLKSNYVEKRELKDQLLFMMIKEKIEYLCLPVNMRFEWKGLYE